MLSQHETLRLRALRDLNLLDTPTSESFDRITRMAGQLFQVPVSAVSLTDQDRQWFKSRVGCPATEIPREHAPCAEVSRSHRTLVVSDLQEDVRFAKGVLIAAGMRFYAGAPLITRDGFCLGSMCVLDQTPREVTGDEIKILQDLAAMVMAQVELQHALGRIDPVSRLPNRNQFIEDLEDLTHDAPRSERVAILIDLADTQHLTDALRVLGPTYVDDLVASSRDLIRSLLGEKIALYHVGMTQFAMTFDDADELALYDRITILQKAFKTPVRHRDIPVANDVAIGTAPFSLGETEPADVLRIAHSAAQDARESDQRLGRYSKSNDDAHQRRFNLLVNIRKELDEPCHLRLVYQPRVDLQSGRLISAEALIRWKHPILDEVSPGEFIPLVESTALIRPLTAWVIESALAQIADWQRLGLSPHVSINVSPGDLEEGFGQRLNDALMRHGVDPRALELEFTEGALIRKRGRVLRDLQSIRDMGVTCAIDDFGTGYSSFSYLQDIPADALKIDQSFIRRLGSSSRDRKLVAALISMGHDLGYRVVAEGVESDESYDFLAKAGCDEGQGYVISRPIEASAFEGWLKNGNPALRPTGPARVSNTIPTKRSALAVDAEEFGARKRIDQPSPAIFEALRAIPRGV